MPKVRKGKPKTSRKKKLSKSDKPEDLEASAAPKQSLFRTDVSFAKLGLTNWIVQTCLKLGMDYPTDIQAMCIPHVLAGKNVAGHARTGSGKTACYSMPILHLGHVILPLCRLREGMRRRKALENSFRHHLSKDPYGVFALILVPVRELAFQVTENFRAMGQAINVTVGHRDPCHFGAPKLLRSCLG